MLFAHFGALNVNYTLSVNKAYRAWRTSHTGATWEQIISVFTRGLLRSWMCSAETHYRCGEGGAETWDTHHERGKTGSEGKNITTRPHWTTQCPLFQNQYTITACESSPLLDIHNRLNLEHVLTGAAVSSLYSDAARLQKIKNTASGPSDAFAVFQVIQSDTRFKIKCRTSKT